MTEYVARPWCRHRRTSAGREGTRKCSDCGALTSVNSEAYWAEFDETDSREPKPVVNPYGVTAGRDYPAIMGG